MRNCFVPGCDQKHKTFHKRAMFSAPKNKYVLQKWIEALPKVRPFKCHDKVCHLHFRTEDIISTYDHTINGQIYQLERGRPRLNAEAVPSIDFPTTEQIKLLSKPVKRTFKNNMVQNRSTSPHSKSMAKDSQNLQEKIEMEAQSTVFLNHIEEIEDGFNIAENVDILEPVQAKQSPEEVALIYSSFYDNINEIQLPNTLWGVHRCPKRSAIFFTFMDVEHLQCTKIVEISCTGLVKVFFVNRLQYEFGLADGINSSEMLSEILKQIDTMESNEDTTQNNADLNNKNDALYIGDKAEIGE